MKLFDDGRHAKAAAGGWILLALLSVPVVPLWVPLAWGVTGLVMLRPRLAFASTSDARYGFLVWLGFMFAWPYVLCLRTADAKFERFLRKSLGSE